MNINSQKSEIISELQKLNRRDLIIFLIPFIIFTVYLAVYNPGILTIDSFNQLHQIATGHYSNWHPFFHTFIEMILIKIYASPVTVGVFQILVFSAMWMVICKYFRNDSQKGDLFKYQTIITLVICLIPINAIYAITLWKDVLFAYAILFLSFLIKVMVDRNGRVDAKFLIAAAVALTFICGLRHNGIYITIITVIAMAIYLYKSDRNTKLHIMLPVLTLIGIVLIASLSLAFDVDDTHRDDMYVKTTHMLADYGMNLDMDEADAALLHELINESKINGSYNIYYADPITWISDEGVFDNNAGDYLALAFRYSAKNPMHTLYYMFKSADIVWDITRDSEWTGQPYYISSEGANVEKAKNQYFSSIHSKPQEGFEDVTDTNLGSAPYSVLNTFVNIARGDLVLGTLFNSPALYIYLAIILMILISVMTKSRDIYLCYLPNLANIIIVFATTTVQDNRFLYANLLVCYLFILILVGVLVKSKGETVENPEREIDGSERYIDEPQQIRSAQQEDADEIERYLAEIERIRNYQNRPPERPPQEIHPSENISQEDVQRPPQRKETPEEMEARIIAEILREMEMQKRK